ncbi:serine kinase [Jannaschia sp. Os4]|uniref:HPr kinase/phosphorylase n=1 Tax=Jannaschia sp. Os4 TaxID=2807617 RepID=UPI00193A6D8E|nr:serine kinase [Jannaschia sp. Os4]MBM2577186.1 serine kinase [Jannaschia sp. Os4]
MPSASLHATAVAASGRALLIVGPSGSGKSSVAAGMVALGAGLIADDLVVVEADGAGVVAAALPAAIAGIEVRGWGVVPVPLAAAAPVAGILRLEPAPARMPPDATEPLLGRPVPLLRHPATPDLAAKALLWLRAQARDPLPAPPRAP